MEIPYTVKPRPDTGLYNAKLGIWLFLASEVMLFGALFSSYVLLRVGAEPGTWSMGLMDITVGAWQYNGAYCFKYVRGAGLGLFKAGRFGGVPKMETGNVGLCGFISDGEVVIRMAGKV